MNKKQISVDGSSELAKVPIRRRNTQGINTEQISITIPKELNQTINGIVVKTNTTRSRVISELIEKGLKSNG